MGNRTVEAVTFDLWNTLIVDTHESGRTRAQRRIQTTWAGLRDYDHTFPIAQIEEAYSTCQKRFDGLRAKGLDSSFHEQIDTFLDIIENGLARGLSPAGKEYITTSHANTFFEEPPVLAPGALAVLEILKTCGYRLGLICNSGVTSGSIQRQFLRDTGVAYYLEVLSFSDEEKLAKPSAGIFLSTLRALDTSPEASVHVGDRPETDVLGAKGIGMKAILIGEAPSDTIPFTPDARILQLAELPGVLDRIEQA